MKYKVGDRVKIRSDLQVDEYYGRQKFVALMRPRSGEVVVIEREYNDGSYEVSGSDYIWSEEMIEGLALENDDVKDDYYAKSAMQPLEVSQVLLTREQFAGALLFNIIKYRMRKKGQDESDAFKARQYAYWLELVRQGKTINPSVDIVPKEWEFKVV